MNAIEQLAAYPYRFLLSLSREGGYVAYASSAEGGQTIHLLEMRKRLLLLHDLPLTTGRSPNQIVFCGKAVLVVSTEAGVALLQLFQHLQGGWCCVSATEVKGTAVRVIGPPPGSDRGLLFVFDGLKTTLIGFQLPNFHLTSLYQLPGVVGGGIWLNNEILAVNHSPHGTYYAGVVVDLAKRCHETVFNLSDRSNETIVGHLEGGRSLLVTTDASGWIRCGIVKTADPDYLHLFGRRADTPSDTLPCGVMGEGIILIHEQRGVLSRLHLWDSQSGTSSEVPLRQGRVYHHTVVVGTRGTRADFFLSAPNLPLGLGTLNKRTSRVSVKTLHCFPREIRCSVPKIKTFTLEGGDVESVCYNWDSKLPVAVFVLHGGPVSQWYFEFDPFLQALAQTRVAVIAPNCSGSTGYGASFISRIFNRFGQRDAEELVLIRDKYIRHDVKVLLVGISYGGYLALSAASRWPDRFSGVAVVSTFASLAELHRDTSPAVKRMLESLNPSPEALSTYGGGGIPIDRIQADLLILHGVLDPIVPVAHAQRMRQRLVEAGWCEGKQFWYIEYPDMEHNLSTYSARRHVFPEIVHFIERHMPMATGGRV